jgi:peptidoglycan LD-endopeptidase LytH
VAITVAVVSFTSCGGGASSSGASTSLAPVATNGPVVEVATTNQPTDSAPQSRPADSSVAIATTTTSSSPITTTPPPSPPPTSPPATSLGASPSRRVVPVVGRVSYGREHHDYPATDMFAPCGTAVVAPVDAVVTELRRDDTYDASTDNPALRGGRSFTLLGVDGVRYYGSHLDTVVSPLEVSDSVRAGDALGTVGKSGRASGCHLHFALSPPCEGREWKVRRGVIWPWRYLDAWANGDNLSPVAEVDQWSSEHPNACADSLAEPTAQDA